MFSIQPFLSKTIFALKIEDSPEFAIEMMNDWNLHSLPVVKEGKYVGMVSKRDLQKASNLEDHIIKDANFLVPEQTFMWKLLELFKNSSDQLKVVVNQNQEYLGCITPQNILRSLDQSFTINSEGIYLRIDISARDYSLAQISHLAESENVKIIGLWIFGQDPDELTILLKTNTVQVAGFISTMRRMGYQILSQEVESQKGNVDSDRIGLLLKYLDI